MRHLVIPLPPDEYKLLKQCAKQQKRLDWQQATWILEQALREQAGCSEAKSRPVPAPAA